MSASEVELVWPREEIEIPLIALHVSALVALQDAEEQYVVFLTLTFHMRRDLHAMYNTS